MPPSPNIPTVDSAWTYLGFGYLEGTNCSTGRGTTRPFEMVGAPFMVNGTLPRVLQSLHLPGVAWREVTHTDPSPFFLLSSLTHSLIHDMIACIDIFHTNL